MDRHAPASAHRQAPGWSFFEAARGLALCVAALAAAVLIGWALDLTPLKRLRPGMVAMNPLTALCLLLAATSCYVQARSPLSRAPLMLARVAAIALLGLGLLRVGGYVFGVDVGVDHLLFAGSLNDDAQVGPNRMAPNTAAAMALSGAALLLLGLPQRRATGLVPILALCACLPCLLALIGYANGVSSLSAVGIFIPMALHTALAVLTLNAGTLCAAAGAARTAEAAEDASSRGCVNRSVEHKAGVGFAAALLVLAAIGIASHRSITQFIADDQRNEQTRRVLESIAELTLAVTDAETGGRGFVIAGSPEFLEPYTAASGRIAAALRDLRELLQESPEQTQRLTALEPLIAHRLEIIERSIALRREHGFGAAQRLVEAGEGKRAMDEIRLVVARMQKAEREQLDLRAAAASAGAKLTVSIISVGSVAGLIFVGAAAYMVRRDMNARRAAEVDLREAKAAADAASNAKGQFLAHMSHEIRTPLNGVIGMLDLLLDTGLSEQQRRFGRLAKASAESLTTVINDILDFSKIEAGKLEIVRSDFGLHQAVEDVVEVMAHKASAKGLELACQIEPDVPASVRGDGDRLRQVLINLISNGIKFTDRGSVLLRLSVEGQAAGKATIRFTVSDTGIGISRDRINRLFKSFSQADASTTRTYGGTGLGLAISKQLAELMGGSIGVVSEPGRGSTFWFTAVLEVRSGPGFQRERVDPRTLRVLAVDDNEIQRSVLRQQIESWGLEAQTAESGDAALAALSEAATRHAPFRVAIVDSDMPGMDGFELAAAVRSRADIRGTVLMILLSVEANLSPAQLRSMGFSGQMTKPVRQSHLFDAIMSAIAAAEADPVPAAVSEQLSPTPRPASGQCGRILLAEDNEVNQLVAREILARAGFQCDVVTNGRDAVQAAASASYDLILMDCQMPIMDGFDATRAIREAERQRVRPGEQPARIPVIALTANAMKGDREKCLEAGMDAYAAKPIDPKQLMQTIQSLLNRPNSAERAA